MMYLCASNEAAATSTDVENFYTCHDDMTWAVNTQEMTPGAQRDLYWQFMKGCDEAFSLLKDRDSMEDCRSQENFRLQMNMYQPRSVYNYTDGFRKARAPDALWKILKEFWDANRNEQVEEWKDHISPYHNSWEAPTTIVRVDNATLVGGGATLKADIANAVQTLVEEWTGMKQAHASVWGIRVYHNNSILSPHIDRLPLVSSVIINVAQDVDEPWPLELYGHDGVAHNVTVSPGDILLYESHSILHGRPFPLRGSYMANICKCVRSFGRDE